MALSTSEPFKAPTVQRLSVRLVVDQGFDQFMPKATHPLCAIEHVSRIRGREQQATLAGEWGLSLHLNPRTAAVKGSTCLISATRRKSCCATSICSASKPASISTG